MSVWDLITSGGGGFGFRVEDEPRAGALGFIVVPDAFPMHLVPPEKRDRTFTESEWRERALSLGYPTLAPELFFSGGLVGTEKVPAWEFDLWQPGPIPAIYDTGTTVWLIVSDLSNPETYSNRTLTVSQVKHRLSQVWKEHQSRPLSDWVPIPTGVVPGTDLLDNVTGFDPLAAALAPVVYQEYSAAAQIADAAIAATEEVTKKTSSWFWDLLGDIVRDPRAYVAIGAPLVIRAATGLVIPVSIPLAVYGIWKAKDEIAKRSGG